LSATYDNTFDSDAPKRSVSLAVGKTLEGGKTKLMLTASYSTEKPLTLQDRMKQIVGPYSARYFGNYPGGEMAYSALPPPRVPSRPRVPCISTNRSSPAPRASRFSRGRCDGGPVPAGYQNFQTNGLGPLQANLGNFDLSFPNTNSVTGIGGLRQPLTQGYANKALGLSLRRQMTDWLELYTQVGTQTNYSPQFDSYSYFSSVVVPATAPGNPFGQAVKVSGVQSGLSGPGITYNTVTQSASAGARFTLPHEWKAELNYTWGLTAVGVLHVWRMDTTALAAAANNGSLNLITDVSRYPYNAASYLSPTVSSQRTSANTLLLKAVGPLMKLWAGAPSLAVGVEHKKTGGKGGYQDLSNPKSATFSGVAPTATITQIAYWPGGSATDNSAYAELTMPLVRKANGIPGVKQLDFQVAARYDDLQQSMTSPVSEHHHQAGWRCHDLQSRAS